ncbi:MAG: UDP-N-acetylglucosamine 1-carboxyvinyltransferase [Clostridia bacterium]|nr:UDP-N-acetylglucosamine 1-carboxyvinyltransferase [Clostridia bacterium]
MEKIIVNGGRRLSGEVMIGGSKNASLPILFGGIVTGGCCVFSRLPRVSDVLRTLEILKCLGARIRFLQGGDVRVDYSTVRAGSPPHTLTSAIRGSTYLLGAMLARFGRAELLGAGGCDFGARPIDQHLMGFSMMGAASTCIGDRVIITAPPEGLHAARIVLAMPSVGATANLMIAAAVLPEESIIENAAAEPHVSALADFLQRAGAEIEGVGTDTIRIKGGKLCGTHYRMIPDMIEAGTYLCMGAACGGPVRVRGVDPKHLSALIHTLRRMGITVETDRESVTASAFDGYRCTNVVTAPYPDFPTDLHPQIAALMALGPRASGGGSVTENVFDSRFRYVEELKQMGASLIAENRTLKITPTTLHAACVTSPDLRGGAALLLAALATKGESEICNAATVGRGYEHLEQKLRGIGAEVSVI